MNLKGKHIFILGLGCMGMEAFRCFYLTHTLTLWDDNIDSRNKFIQLYPEYASMLCNPNLCNWSQIDILMPSSGISLNHKAITLAREHVCDIVSDVDLLYLQYPNSKYINITGSMGKSTTTAMIHHLLSDNDIQNEMGGNIAVGGMGRASLGLEMSSNYVLEVCSFQLEITNYLKSYIAIITGITPNHLDRHGTMDNYIKAKTRIFKNSTLGDYLIIGVDTEVSCELYHDIVKTNPAMHVIPVSSQKTLSQGGVFFQGDKIIIMDSKLGHHEIAMDIVGYNINFLIALTVGMIFQIPNNQILSSFATFQSLPHRMQIVKQTDTIIFVNNSKATSMESAIMPLQTYTNIHWLAGGSIRDWDMSIVPLDNIRAIYLFGESAQVFSEIFAKVNDNISCYIHNNMEEAFNHALSNTDMRSSEHSTILLNPACTSYDQYQNFGERGEHFQQLVCNYEQNT